MNKQITKAYLNGYLNQKKVYYEIYKSSSNNITERDFKIMRVLNYWSMPDFLSSCMLDILKILSYFELPLSVVILAYRFCFLFFYKIFNRARNYNATILLFPVSFREDFYEDLMNRSGINDYDILVIPFVKYNISRRRIVKVIDYVSLKDIFVSFKWSLEFVHKYIFKFSKDDCMFRFYSIFEYFIFYHYLKRYSSGKKFYFLNTIDRWIYLFDIMNVNASWIQHGIMDKDLNLYKVQNIKEAYYLNEQQKKVINKYLFSKEPIPFFIHSIKLNDLPASIPKTRPTFLLICNPFFREAEDYIINAFCYEKYNLILKLHPKHPIDFYLKIQKKHPFFIAKQNTFPKVDIVISYKSTLADDYARCGVKVLVYGNVGEANVILDHAYECIKN